MRDSVQVNRNKLTENVKYKFTKMALVCATIYYMLYMEKWDIPLNLGVTAKQSPCCGATIQERHIPRKWVCLCTNPFPSMSKKSLHYLTTFWRTCTPQPPLPPSNELLRIKCKEIFPLPLLNHKKAGCFLICLPIHLPGGEFIKNLYLDLF